MANRKSMTPREVAAFINMHNSTPSPLQSQKGNSRTNGKGGPNMSASILQSNQDKILSGLKDAGVKASPIIAARIAQKFPSLGVAYTAYKNLPPKHQAIIQDAAVKAFKGMPSPLEQSKGDSVMNSSYGLSKAPNPKPVALNSGILPNAYASDWMVPTFGTCSPMHMNCVKMGIPTGALEELSLYFRQNIAFDIQTRAQANVGFNLDISGNLSATQLLLAMNSAITALQVYFYYSSILTYESNPRNKNSGMYDLRNKMSAQLISDLTKLGRRLEDTPVPPRIVEWVRYMNMNYLAGDTQGSTIIKLCPDVSVTEGFPTGVTLPAVALSGLTDVTVQNTFTLIRRSIPQWRVGTLYDVPVVPCFDKNFLTIFSNCPAAHNVSTVEYTHPEVPLLTSPLSYNSFNNKLDGAAYAMCSAYQTPTDQWYPGLLIPSKTTTLHSRRSYYTNGTVTNWENSIGNTFLVQSRLDSYQTFTAAGTPTTPHLFGAERVLGVTSMALAQTAKNFMDFIFNVDSIPLRGKLSHFNNSANRI